MRRLVRIGSQGAQVLVGQPEAMELLLDSRHARFGARDSGLRVAKLGTPEVEFLLRNGFDLDQRLSACQACPFDLAIRLCLAQR